jgi:hypothetical protein
MRCYISNFTKGVIDGLYILVAIAGLIVMAVVIATLFFQILVGPHVPS